MSSFLEFFLCFWVGLARNIWQLGSLFSLLLVLRPAPSGVPGAASGALWNTVVLPLFSAGRAQVG